MALAAGARLGAYEVNGLIGIGAMGEVYRARDTRLDRLIAIKVLPPALAADPQFRERFEREARTISQLNHPHICTLHDLGHDGGVDFLVMEYVDGETVEHRLKQGPIAVLDALPLAHQIAGALEAAHERGIVHRDLKPANIKVTSDGWVKVLDFGLAKSGLVAGSASLSGERAGGLSMSPTVLAGGTQAGVILGTAAYMSPEQARGLPVDKRADIWAFGCVLYEMLTGTPAFGGATVSDIIAAIVRDEPAWDALPPETPTPIRRLLRRCLEKDPRQRWRDIGDARIELEAAVSEDQTSAPAPTALTRTAWSWVAAAIFALTTLALAGFQLVKPASPDRPVVRFVVRPPDRATLGQESESLVTVSPDGRRLVFAAATDGRQRLWVRALDSPDSQPLADTDDADAPFWSPDSRYLGFFAGGKLKEIDMTGGPSQTVCATTGSFGVAGTWNRDGVIVFADNGRLYRVSITGGAPILLSMSDRSRGGTEQMWPSFLPDGRHFLYFAPGGVFVGSLDSTETKRVLAVNSKAEYVPPGYVLFVRERTLFAQPFDSNRLEPAGEAVPVADQVRGSFGSAAPAFSVSPSGVLAYGADFVPTTRLTWFGRRGNQLGSFGSPGTYAHIELSPDDSQVAVEIFDVRSRVGNVWVVDPSRGTATRVTDGPDWNYAPIWSPDGTRILFSSRRQPDVELHQKLANGAGPEEALTKPMPGVAVANDWSRDGRFIIYQWASPALKLWMLPLFGDRQLVPLLKTSFNEAQGRLSPDGRWLAYTSDESGRNEVYVQAFPPSGARWQLSTGGGSYPRWRRDGKELFYLAADQKLMAATVSGTAIFHAAEPNALFEMRGTSLNELRYPYAVTADGQRFLVNLPTGQDTPSITVILNWTSALKH